MTRLVWDEVDEPQFETGVDYGVLYTTDGKPVPWNGLVSITETPSGGEATPYYLDGIKYLNISSREDLGGTIEAYTYPDEFGIHDGTLEFDTGLIAHQQKRKPFALSYRTVIGNDLDGIDYGYKLHIIYNVLAAPSQKAYSTINESVSPMTFSWTFTTTPQKITSSIKLAPLAHVTIDSTKTDPTFLRYIENRLYGSKKRDGKLMSLAEIIAWFEKPFFIFGIDEHSQTGLNELDIDSEDADLVGEPSKGLYIANTDSRLTPTSIPGFYTLGS